MNICIFLSVCGLEEVEASNTALNMETIRFDSVSLPCRCRLVAVSLPCLTAKRALAVGVGCWRWRLGLGEVR